MQLNSYTKKPSEWKFIASSATGVFLEYFDFVLYAHVSVIFAKLFFPFENKMASMLAAWVPFLIGFLFRPLGSVVFGILGDKAGCRLTLLLSMSLMSVSTAAIGLVPTYEQIGIWAPIILIFFRIIQGVSVSPEYNGASTYLSYKEDKYFNFKCSFTVVTTGLGMVAGSFLISKMTSGYTVDTLPEWRWRLPFILFGLILGVPAILLRMNMAKGLPINNVANPLKSIYRKDRKPMIISFFVSSYVGVIAYSLFGFISAFLQRERGYEIHQALYLVGLSSLSIVPANFIAGYMADKFSTRWVMSVASFLTSIVAILTYFFLSVGSFEQVKYYILLYGFSTGLFTGVVPGFLAKLFRDEHRYTGSCISYNLGIAVFGGTTPIIMTILSASHHVLPGIFLSTFSIFILFILFQNNKSDSKNKEKRKLDGLQEKICGKVFSQNLG